jgi:galacturan 1,4-alpha-galacturonidase
MRFQLTTLLTVATATFSVATPAWQAVSDWSHSSAGKSSPDHVSPRPQIHYSKHPHTPPPSPPPRTKVCYVKSHNDSKTDDTPYILSALHECNNGGHAVFREGVKYYIGTAMDLTFLNHIDLGKVFGGWEIFKDTQTDRFF